MSTKNVLAVAAATMPDLVEGRLTDYRPTFDLEISNDG